MPLLNFGLMKHPLNWVTILLMLVIVGMAVHLICSHYKEVSDSPAASSIAA
jgi:hypothetical protein